MEPVSRRKLLHVVVVSAAASAASSVVVGCRSGAPQSFGDVSGGTAADLGIGEIRLVADAPCFVARDAGGVYAMTTTCTHEGCDMASGISGSNVYCYCHGSEFDADGNVLRGPANAPLQHFAVTIDASGAITVHGGQPVDASVRA